MNSTTHHNGPILNAPEEPSGKKSPTWAMRAFLLYDIVIMVLIVVNLLTIAVDQFMFTHIGLAAAQFVDQVSWIFYYREQLHPVVQSMDEWITIYLVSELLVRWLVAIVFKQHYRWFFFPFIHWYEFLACIPTFRALRLLRATVIGYRLHQLGYKVLPDSWLKTGLFYYQVIMEELSDRIVLTILDGVERELKNGAAHHQLLHQLVNSHRIQIEQAIGEILQNNLATALQAQQQHIALGVGKIVSQAIAETPELYRILRLIPVVGSRLEQQLQSIGQHLAENITAGLIQPFAQPASASQPVNTALNISASYVGQLQIDTPALEKLVESLVFESLEVIRQQVKVQHWKLEQAAQQELA